MTKERVINEIQNLLINGKTSELLKVVKEALSNEVSPWTIYEEGLIGGMGILSRKLKKEEVFIPQILMAGLSINECQILLEPYLNGNEIYNGKVVVIGTVKGDLHDIGKNLVKVMLCSRGFKVIDLGNNVSAESFIQATKDNDADIIMCSALLTTTMTEMKKIVSEIHKFGVKAKIMVGGAPVTKKFALSIGADAYTPDARMATEKAVELCGL